MKKQELLINFVLLVVTGALIFAIYRTNDTPDYAQELSGETTETTSTLSTETKYRVEIADAKYKKIGSTELFKPLLSPTPIPPTPTPPPTKTPDVKGGLANWKLESAMDGEAMILDKALEQKDPENARWTMRVGDTRPVDFGKDQGVKNVKLLKMDEASDNPGVTFGMDEVPDQHTIKMMEEAPNPE